MMMLFFVQKKPLLLLLLLLAPTTQAHQPKPNLLFVLVDDWGRYNVGFHGNALAQTPFMDGLVKDEALLLERSYTYKFCSPTRRSLLTGRFPPHSGEDNSVQATLDYRMPTLAETLERQGYSTHVTGKWHAGHASVSQVPTSRGFDSFLGYFNGKEDHYSHRNSEDACPTVGDDPTVVDLWNATRTQQGPASASDGIFGDQIFADRVLSLIRVDDSSPRQSRTPWFVYWATQCAHDPLQAPQALVDRYADAPSPVQYALVGFVDDALRNVTHVLKATGAWDDTLVVVHSDNGGPAFSDQKAASNYPLRGGKYSLFEGGLRANAFVSGGFLPKHRRGQTYSQPLHVCDWFATFARLAGASIADASRSVPALDAVDQWDALLSSSSSSSAEERVLFLASGAVVLGDYKLIAADAGNAQWSGPLYPQTPATGPPHLNCSARTPCLFDVVRDPSETTDLAPTRPDLVASLNATLADLMLGVFEGSPDPATAQSQDAVCAATRRSRGVLTPGDYYDDGDIVVSDDDDVVTEEVAYIVNS